MHVHTHNDKKLQRQSIREYVRSVRRIITPQEKNVATQLLTNKTIIIDHIQNAKNIGIYMAYDGEINTNILIKNLLAMKKNVYLPVLPITNTKRLLFYKYTLSTPLIYNRFNIYEPIQNTSSNIPTKNLDIIFVPIVAFNKHGHRLGMGGGFYDSTLQQISSNNKLSCVFIGLAYDFQKIPTKLLPIEQWDVQLSEIITPTNHWIW